MKTSTLVLIGGTAALAGGYFLLSSSKNASAASPKSKPAPTPLVAGPPASRDGTPAEKQAFLTSLNNYYAVAVPNTATAQVQNPDQALFAMITPPSMSDPTYNASFAAANVFYDLVHNKGFTIAVPQDTMAMLNAGRSLDKSAVWAARDGSTSPSLTNAASAGMVMMVKPGDL